MPNSKDQDRFKGALEQEEKSQTGNTSMQGQLGHRDQDPMLKAADTDFPEPGENPEHTGEPEDGPKRTQLLGVDEEFAAGHRP